MPLIRSASCLCSCASSTDVKTIRIRMITAAVLVLWLRSAYWSSRMVYRGEGHHIDLSAIMLSIVSVLPSHSANVNVVRSSSPCPAMMGDMLFDSTINRTMRFSTGKHRNAFSESGVVQKRATGRISITRSPVSVRLVQVQVQGKWSLWWRAEWNDSYKRPRTSASQSPAPNSAVAVFTSP